MAIDLKYDNDLQHADLVQDPDIGLGNLLAINEGLEPAVTISLFTDRRAEPADISDPTERRGWWGDTFPDVPEDRIGSRLWLLGRAKTTDETLQLAERFILECLQWLIEDGVASSVKALPFYLEDVTGTGPRKTLCATITIERPNTPSPRFVRTWVITELTTG